MHTFKGQVHPVSTPHVIEQPSPAIALPSSHASEITIPSSQITEHIEGSPVQSQPISFEQLDWQPSLLSKSPSSHYSKPLINPSEQIGEQTLFGHSQPVSISQVELHPSPI